MVIIFSDDCKSDEFLVRANTAGVRNHFWTEKFSDLHQLSRIELLTFNPSWNIHLKSELRDYSEITCNDVWPTAVKKQNNNR